MSTERKLARHSPVAPFVGKLYEMLNKPESEPYIRWNDVGDTIVIIEPDGLMVEVLPHYFKHTKLCSFIRQLNMYGFEKLSDKWEFRHQEGLFRRDSPHLLEKILRRAAAKKGRSPEGDEDDDEMSRHQDQKARREGTVEIKPMDFDLKAYEERQTTQESTLHFLLESVHAQRQELAQLKSQVNLLTNFILALPGQQQASPALPASASLPAPALVPRQFSASPAPLSAPAPSPSPASFQFVPSSPQPAPPASPRFSTLSEVAGRLPATYPSPPQTYPATPQGSQPRQAAQPQPAAPRGSSPFHAQQQQRSSMSRSSPHVKESPTHSDEPQFPAPSPAFYEDPYAQAAVPIHDEMEWNL